MPRPIEWQLGTVTGIQTETPTVRSFTLGLPEWLGHRAGQHVDIRLTAEDGYSVERSYSIASEPELAGQLEITVERIPNGEVSPFLHDVLVEGDRLEVRGPIGGYFVWETGLGGPLFTLNGFGYVTLAAAYAVGALVPLPIVQRFAWLPRVGLAGYALTTPTAARLDRLQPADRRPNAGRGPRTARERCTDLHLRPDGARRDGR